MSRLGDIFARAANEPISDGDALHLDDLTSSDHSALLAAAQARRNRARPATLSFSPKLFLPLTNLCRNRCDYCSFRKSPGDPGEWTMAPNEVIEWLDRGRETGCVEALFCLGDKPETGFSAYRRLLASWGFSGTVDYLVWAGERALERGLLPHTNAGILSRDDMARLRPVNVSLGLMLETVSDRLCGPGMPHHRAPDKRPAVRLAMTREAGELAIPFTSGLLIGIGETRLERIETLLAIRQLHHDYGHIQEVIVQNFRARPQIPMASAAEPSDTEMAETLALARLVLPDDVSLQAPPNLNPTITRQLIDAGLNDFGGISPVTPDYINPAHPWPHLAELAQACREAGFELVPRLPLYDDFLRREDFVDPRLVAPVRAARTRMGRGEQFGVVPAELSVQGAIV